MSPTAKKSLPFLYLNTNKRSITLNLKTDEGRGILMDLLADADALVENFAPRVMPSLGLDHETLLAHNPGWFVHRCRISDKLARGAITGRRKSLSTPWAA